MDLLRGRRRLASRRPASARPVSRLARVVLGQAAPGSHCYACALLLVAAAAGLSSAWTISPAESSPFFLYLPAVILSSLIGGLGPGLLALAASLAAILCINIPPPGALKLPSAPETAHMGAFAGVGGLVILMNLYLRRVTKALAQTESRFRRLVEGIRDYAVVVLDPDGIVLSWNAGAERISGYAAEQAIGLDCSALAPAQAHSLKKELEQARLHGRFEEECWGRRKDGSRFWASVVTNAVRDEEGRLIGFSKIMRDLTERRKSDKHAQHGDAGYRQLVDNVADYAIYRLDAEGCVATWNDGAERIMGWRAEEIIGEHVSRFYRPEDVAAGQPAANLRAAAEKGRVESESWKVRKDGTRFWADVNLTALRDSTGELVGFAKVTRDLTERKLAEEAVAAKTRQLEKAVVDLEAFSYTVSHDLRAPLRAVQGYAALLLKRGAGDAETKPLLSRIADSAGRMDRLIKDLLSYSGISSAAAAMEPVDLDAVAGHIALQYAELGDSLRFGKPLGRVLGQESLLTQALSNLVDNAAKFCAPGDVPLVEVSAERAGGKVKVVVRDHGIGVPPESQRKIFEPFIRLDRAFEGTGIGLAIVKKAVARMGGSVGVESRPGEGSRFWFELPEA